MSSTQGQGDPDRSSSLVEVSRISAIHVRNPTSPWKIIFTQESGDRNVFDLEFVEGKVFLDCKWFLDTQLEMTIQIKEARLALERKFKTKLKDSLARLTRRREEKFVTKEEKTITLDRVIGQEVVVNFDDGLKLTLAFVSSDTTALDELEARLKPALTLLDSKKESLERFARGSDCLDILLECLKEASDIIPIPVARAVVGIVNALFKTVNEIPNAYLQYCDIFLDAVTGLDTLKEATRVFKTDMVAKALQRLIEEIQKAIKKIVDASNAQDPRLKWRPLRTSDVDGVRTRLESCRATLRDAYTVEMGSTLREVFTKVDNIEHAVLFQPLFPPTNYSGVGKRHCLEGTRTSVLDRIMEWVFWDFVTSRLLWLHGIAGCGKSTIAVTVATHSQTRLAGTFFCDRSFASLSDPIRLIRSIAFSLAKFDLRFRDALRDVLREPERLNNTDIRSHFELLLSGPISSMDGQPSQNRRLVFIIDALDECERHGELAGVLIELLHIAPWIKLLVTSRPQPDIAKAFERYDTRDTIDLFDFDARDDIGKVLLREIEAQGRLASIAPLINSHKDDLVRRSQGLFIWLQTIILFMELYIGDFDVLDRLLGPQASSEGEHALDTLYRAVLENASKKSPVAKKIIPYAIAIVFTSTSSAPLSPRVLRAFLPSMSVTLSAVEDVIAHLGAILINGPGGIVVTHKSVLDFFASEARCGIDNWISPGEAQRIMATRCFDIMLDGWTTHETVPELRTIHSPGLRQNMCELESSYKRNCDVRDPELGQRIDKSISPELRYSSLHWGKLFLLYLTSHEGGDPSTRIKPDLPGVLKRFLCTEKSLFWLECLSLLGGVDAAREVLLALLSKASSMLKPVAAILTEIRSFVEQCWTAITTSGPHLYLSLTWIATESDLGRAWKDHITARQILKKPLRHAPQLIQSFAPLKKVDTFTLSPDGSQIASGSRDGIIRIFNALTGLLVKEVRFKPNEDESRVDNRHGEPPKPSQIDAIVFTPDARHIFCASGHAVYRLDCGSLEILDRVSSISEGSPVRSMAVSSSQIAFGLERGGVNVLDADSMHTMHSFSGDTPVNVVAFSPDGSRLASSSEEWGIRLWDMHSGSVVDSPFDSIMPTALTFSPDGTRLVYGDLRGTIEVREVTSGRVVGGWNVKHPMLFLAFSPDGGRILTAQADQTDWKFIKAGEPIDLPPLSEARCHVVGRWFDGTQQYGWSMQTTVQIWNADVLFGHRAEAAGHTDDVQSVAISHDGKRIVSGSDDCTVRVWDAQTGEHVKLAEMRQSSSVLFVALSPDGRFIASGGNDVVIRIWDAETGEPVHVLEGHSDSVICGAYSPDGSRIVSGSNDRTLRVWDALNGRQVGEPMEGHQHWVDSVAYAPDGSCIASGSMDGTIRFWDGQTGESLGTPVTGLDERVYCVVFSPDSTRLASGGSSYTVQLWDVSERCSVGTPMRGHSSTTPGIAFTPDGSHIISASDDRTIRCWDTSDGQPIGNILTGHSGGIYSLAISKDGSRIVTCAYDHSIRAWDTQAFQWEADRSLAACGLLGPDNVPSSISDDGWIHTSDGGLLLFVPPEHRRPICDLSSYCISQNEADRPLRLDWGKLYHGNQWAMT